MDDDDDGMIVDIADTTPFLQWPSAAWPTSMVPPQSQAMYPAVFLGQRFVGLERRRLEPVFTHLPDLEGEMNKGIRGRDQKNVNSGRVRAVNATMSARDFLSWSYQTR
jgi:hypothetical protein